MYSCFCDKATPCAVGINHVVSVRLWLTCQQRALVGTSCAILELQRKMTQWKWANTTTPSTSPSTIAVAVCELQPELFEGHPSCRVEVLPQDESIGDAYIKKKW